MFPSSTIMIILIFELPAVEHFLNWIPNTLNISKKHEWQFHLAGCIFLRDALWRLFTTQRPFFPLRPRFYLHPLLTSQHQPLFSAWWVLWAPVSVPGYRYSSARATSPLGYLSSRFSKSSPAHTSTNPAKDLLAPDDFCTIPLPGMSWCWQNSWWGPAPPCSPSQSASRDISDPFRSLGALQN